MLSKLLQANRQYAPIYHPQANTLFSNHVSMVLIALDQMGATNKTLQQYCDNHSEQQEYVPQQSVTINENNWREFLGQYHYYLNYEQFFQQEYQRLGREQLLKHYLPELQASITCHLFHAAIRMAYGLIAKDDQELVCSLAYLASLYRPFNVTLNAGKQTLTPTQFFEQLSAIPWKDKLVNNASIDNLMQQPEFQQLTSEYTIGGLNLSTIAQMAKELYLSEANIITLHCVTGSHALRLLLPYIDEPNQALNAYWQMISCARALYGQSSTTNESKPSSTELDWQAIFKQISQSQDSHTIKLAFTCYQEHQHYNDPDYLSIAQILAIS